MEDYNEGYYDFHCTTLPQSGTEWYMICGTDYKNQMEYRVLVTGLSLFALHVYMQMLKYSGRLPRTGMPRAVVLKMKRQ